MKTDPNFVDSIITGNESLCFVYDPLTKERSAACVDPKSPCAKKLCFQKLKIKIMLILFFNSSEVVHKEFVLLGQTGWFGGTFRIRFSSPDLGVKWWRKKDTQDWKLKNFSPCLWASYHKFKVKLQGWFLMWFDNFLWFLFFYLRKLVTWVF